MPFPTFKTASNLVHLVSSTCSGERTLTKIKNVAETLESQAYNQRVKKQLKSVISLGFEGESSYDGKFGKQFRERIKASIDRFFNKGPLGKELDPVKSDLAANLTINVPKNLVILNHKCFTNTENDHFKVDLIKRTANAMKANTNIPISEDFWKLFNTKKPAGCHTKVSNSMALLTLALTIDQDIF